MGHLLKWLNKDGAQKKGHVELAEQFEIISANVKSKINGLRAKLGREMGKESKTESGPATSEQ